MLKRSLDVISTAVTENIFYYEQKHTLRFITMYQMSALIFMSQYVINKIYSFTPLQLQVSSQKSDSQ